VADIEKIVIGKTGYLYLATKEGKVIMAPDKRYLLGRAFPVGENPLFDKALYGFEGTELGTDLMGEKALISFKSIPSTQWILIAVYPENEAFSSFQVFKERLIYLIIFFFSFFLFLGWGFTYGLANKLKTLLDNLRKTNTELVEVKLAETVRAENNTRFFQEASHDFSQRLHAMQLLIHTAERSTNNEIRSLFSRLAYVVENLQSYVREFLEFARLETTSLNINLKKVLVMDVFQRLELQFENVASERNIELKFRNTSIELESDEKKLLRILENLIANACKFARRKVLVACRRVGETISIEVYDDGMGISANDRDQIFNAHYQGVQPDQTSTQDGVGLGLSIAHRLATCLGYAVTFQTKIAHGTVFKVSIPQNSNNDQNDEKVHVENSTARQR
jgi:signal transduction histidine kinase